MDLVQAKNTVSGDSERKDGFFRLERGRGDVIGPRGDAGQLLHYVVGPKATGEEGRGGLVMYARGRRPGEHSSDTPEGLSGVFLKPFSSWRTFCHNYQTNALVTAEGVEMFRVLIGEISMSGGRVQGAG